MLSKNFKATLHQFIAQDKAYSFISSIKGTPAYWKKLLFELLAMVNQLVIPKFFMTLSCVDLRWNELTQPANTGPQDVPRMSPSNVPRTSPKDPIWPSRERPDLTSWGRPNLTFKRRTWEVDSGRPQNVLRTFTRGCSKHSKLDVPKFLFLIFLSELIRLIKSI